MKRKPGDVVSRESDVLAAELSEQNLRRSAEAVRKLYEITISHETAFDERVRQVLALGCRCFDLELAILSRVEEDRYHVVNVHSTGPLEVDLGTVFDLGRTYCLDTLAARETIGFESASQGRWATHPAYEALSLEAYLGTPVYVGSEVFGTLNFSNRLPRENPFIPTEKVLLQLMAKWISSELERQQADEALAKSEEQLRRSQKMEAVGQLAGGVAHDFNNLLQVIHSAAELARGALPGGHLSRAYLDEVLQAADRAATLSRQLLTFSRRETLNPVPLDLSKVISEMTNMLIRVIGEHIQLKLEIAEDLLTVIADPGQIEQIVMNLCVNARDAMPDGGELSIDLRNEYRDSAYCQHHRHSEEGNYVVMTLRDTGVGMSPEVREHIFEPFFTTKEWGRGTGLGLATVYAIVERMKGHIHVHSAPQVGTTFEMDFPTTEMTVSRETEPVDDEVISSRGGETILLAEDDQPVRDLAAKILESGGYNVIVARDGEEAIALFEQNRSSIDMSILDVVMPKKSGREVFDRIVQCNPDACVLFSSGYSHDDFKTDDYVSRPVHSIEKPYRPKKLLARVRELLDSRP